MIEVISEPLDRLRQGDVIAQVPQFESYEEVSGNIQIQCIRFPLAIVLTQDCDLEGEHNLQTENNQNKALISVLVAPIYNADDLKGGEHLSDDTLNMQMRAFGRKDWNPLTQNRDPRYHYLQFDPLLRIQDGVIDFKHYFSVGANMLRDIKKDQFVCSIDILYREQISQRFAAFLSRIGLPG